MRINSMPLIILFTIVLPARASTFFGLGDLPGGDHLSDYNAVSANGTVAVGYSNTHGNSDQGIRWRLCDDIFEVPGCAAAVDVSGDGKVVVGNIGGGLPTRWSKADGATPLVDPTGEIEAGGSHSASFDGSIVVGTGDTDTGFKAFRWTAVTGMASLGDFPGGDTHSQGRGVSHDGTVIVGWGTSDLGRRAFRWTSSTGMAELGPLPVGVTLTQAEAVSGDGLVAVGRMESASGTEAFRWTSAGGIAGLGDLPGGPFFSWAWSTSMDGSVIVGYSDSSRGRSAFIWTEADGMRELQDVLSNDYGLDLMDWHLEVAFGISADGNAIVGRGLNPQGEIEGWIAYLNCLPGDANGDDKVDGLDLGPFAQALLDPGNVDSTTICTFDLNRDESIDLTDIPMVVELLICDCDS
ncbi:MAG: dockerin type I domain-containing protein [Phycisphaerales bacterium]|nr:dockerin type I domain-containing protein [Phycisphaerales bacterium]